MVAPLRSHAGKQVGFGRRDRSKGGVTGVWWPHLSAPSGLMSMERLCTFDVNLTADDRVMG
jgi:hypothetical protein